MPEFTRYIGIDYSGADPDREPAGIVRIENVIRISADGIFGKDR